MIFEPRRIHFNTTLDTFNCAGIISTITVELCIQMKKLLVSYSDIHLPPSKIVRFSIRSSVPLSFDSFILWRRSD